LLVIAGGARDHESMRRLSFMLLAMVLSSCGVRAWVDVAIDRSNSGQVTLTFATDQELRDGLASISQGIDPAATITSGLEEQGWTVETSSDGNWMGVVARHTFSDLAELESLVAQAGQGTGLQITDTGRGYTLRAELSTPTVDDQNAALMSQAAGVIDIDGRLSVRFPGKVVTTNGTVNQAGDTVTWTYDAKSLESGLTLQADVRKPIGILVPIAAGLGLAAIAAVVWWTMRRRQDARREVEPVAPVEAADEMGD
jgi:hypothetical protein